MGSDVLNFDRLVGALTDAHGALEARAAKAVNVSLTLRNWLFGHYICEYEQSGADRGAYGERLLETLAQRLQQTGLKRIDAASCAAIGSSICLTRRFGRHCLPHGPG